MGRREAARRGSARSCSTARWSSCSAPTATSSAGSRELQRRRHDWPADVFAANGRLPVASRAALAGYRSRATVAPRPRRPRSAARLRAGVLPGVLDRACELVLVDDVEPQQDAAVAFVVRRDEVHVGPGAMRSGCSSSGICTTSAPGSCGLMLTNVLPRTFRQGCRYDVDSSTPGSASPIRRTSLQSGTGDRLTFAAMSRSWGELLGEAGAEPESEVERRGLFGRLRESLGKSRRALGEQLHAAAFDPEDDGSWERLEEALIYADVGVRATAELMRRLEARAGPDRADRRARRGDRRAVRRAADPRPRPRSRR